jgi:YD repeat-containing protein
MTCCYLNQCAQQDCGDHSQSPGQPLTVKDPLNRETKRILDAAGRLRSLINPLGQKTIYTPDALDRITQLTDAINGVTQFGYDANSNLLTVTDAKTQQTVYENRWGS